MAETKTINWLTVGVTVLALFFGALYFNQCNKTKTGDKDAITLLNALQDSMHYYKDKSTGDSIARVALISTNENLFLEVKSKDSSIISLQKEVVLYKGKLKPGSSVTTGKVVTTIVKEVPVEVIKRDTIKGEVWPTYKSTYSDQWVDIQNTVGKTTNKFSIRLNSKFTAVIGVEKGRPFADFKTDNPYAVIKEFRSYQVEMPKQKQFGLGFFVGGTYIANKFRPVAGAGITYTPIHF